MKKILKRVFVIVFAATLFAMPVSTAYAASSPVLVYSDDTTKMFEFQPDPYYLAANGVTLLLDENNPMWFTPAGHGFFIKFDLAQGAAFTVSISKIEPSGGQIIYTGTFGPYMEFFTYYVNPDSSDANYVVVINAISDLYITSYGSMIH